MDANMLRFMSMFGVRPRDEEEEELNLGQPPETPAMDAFRTHVQNIPQRPEKSNAHKILMSLFGGVLGPEKVLAASDAPFRREVEDHTRKGEGLSRAAQIESTQHETKRRYAKDAAEIFHRNEERGRKDREFDETRRHHEALEGDRAADNTRADSDLKFRREQEANLTGHRSRMAGAAERQAAAAERRAGAAETRANRPTNVERPFSPKSQMDAKQLATQQLIEQNPHFAKFVDQETGQVIPPQDGMFSRVSDQDKRDFQQFLNLLHNTQQTILNRRPGAPGFGRQLPPGVEEDDDF